MKPLLVGELNPYGDDDHFALYPRPERASGHRLCTLVMGLREADYLRRFDRANLCYRKWSIVEARRRASELLKARPCERQPDGPPIYPTIVLLGSKVCSAFGVEYAPFSITTHFEAWADLSYREYTAVVLPHPSGLCRTWNEPGAFDKARVALVAAGVL